MIEFGEIKLFLVKMTLISDGDPKPISLYSTNCMFSLWVMKPPYTITPSILQQISSIAEKIGEINASHLQLPKASLRKAYRIKTINSSLEIEGNTLSIEQVTAILDNKRVVAPEKDILEVTNAIAIYEQLDKFEPASLDAFLKAHALLMKGLIPSAGKIRSKGAGIVKGSQVAHPAPPACVKQFY